MAQIFVSGDTTALELPPNGHPGNSTSSIDANQDGLADDPMIEIPAVGAAGGAPWPGFLEGMFGS
jgi:hypothetical protein